MHPALARAIALIAPPRCSSCGGNCAAGEWVCMACLRLLRAAPESKRAAFINSGVARDLVLALKFRGEVALAGVMAELMLERLPRAVGDAEWIVPAPPHPARSRVRGYSPATLIARELARRTGARSVECLTRDGARRPQSELARAERLAMPAHSIAVSNAALRHAGIDPLAEFPTNVVVCDEVTTTGVTLELCAQAIRERQPEAGPRQIRFLSFASTEAHGSTDRIARRQSRRTHG